MSVNEDYVREACQPYDGPDLRPAVYVSSIIDRLTDEEVRMLAIVLSAANPCSFETWLRRIWARRQDGHHD